MDGAQTYHAHTVIESGPASANVVDRAEARMSRFVDKLDAEYVGGRSVNAWRIGDTVICVITIMYVRRA